MDPLVAFRFAHLPVDDESGRSKKICPHSQNLSHTSPLEPEDRMEGWNGEANWNRDVLERIVALLCALANLADLAAGASFLRRRRVLGFVSHGEAEARAFVIGMACGEQVSADALESTGDAVHLAVRLRALALMLCAMLANAALFALPGAAGACAGRRSQRIGAPSVCRLEAPPASDTS
jgi:hypothetical protein